MRLQMADYKTLQLMIKSLERSIAQNNRLVNDILAENRELKEEVAEFQDAKRFLYDLINSTEDLFSILVGEATGDVGSILDSYRESRDKVYEAMFKEEVAVIDWQEQEYGS